MIPEEQHDIQHRQPLRPNESDASVISDMFCTGWSSLAKLRTDITNIVTTPYGTEGFMSLHSSIDTTINNLSIIIHNNISYNKNYSQELAHLLVHNYSNFQKQLKELAHEFKARTDVYRSCRLKNIYKQIKTDRIILESKILIRQYITHARNYEIQGVSSDKIHEIETFIDDYDTGMSNY